jgi:urea carboxylase
MTTRYTFGGDEHLFVEISVEMSLRACLKALFICNVIREANWNGIQEICPANASYQVRFDPDLLSPDDLVYRLQKIEKDIGESSLELDTRIIEVPVFYNDPWTNETMKRFRDRHQDPGATDLEYAARINKYSSVEDFVEAHSRSPWFVSMVGFVAGLPFMYQMVDRERQIEVPKYLRPRTDTPKLTVGHGGCFGCVYSVRGAGGYQMFGITPIPIFDPEKRQSYIGEALVLFKPGDIVKLKAIGREEFDQISAAAEEGSYSLKTRPVSFALSAFDRDSAKTTDQLTGRLYGN